MYSLAVGSPNVCDGMHMVRYCTCSGSCEQVYEQFGNGTLECCQMDSQVFERWRPSGKAVTNRKKGPGRLAVGAERGELSGELEEGRRLSGGGQAGAAGGGGGIGSSGGWEGSVAGKRWPGTEQCRRLAGGQTGGGRGAGGRCREAGRRHQREAGLPETRQRGRRWGHRGRTDRFDRPVSPVPCGRMAWI
ncbi:glycine-rich cell wall structural protein 1.0-like [Cryptomeria japonica]|uniref:glycine-rich cell wall structural protein 1.0-like n=1 Tax=Cryptomeria japonica TaxID=3369 RepID=UPI0027D9FFB3|nr:glycine-rich cell wall structural protein 1.0-like [Cryptomeria japonica]